MAGSLQLLMSSGFEPARKSGDASGDGYAPGQLSSPEVTTNTVTITPSGRSYSWSHVSGATATVNASGNTASFTRTALGSGPGNIVGGVYRCTVTGVGTVDVTVTTTHFNDNWN